MPNHRTSEKKLKIALKAWRETGDVSAAARKAGVSRATLYREIEKQPGGGRAKASSAKPRTQKGRRVPAAAATDVSVADAAVADVDEQALDELIADLRRRLGVLPAASPRCPSLAGVLAAALERRRRMRPPPPPDPAEEIERRRREDAETRLEIEQYVAKLESEATAKGVCVHCGQKTSGTAAGAAGPTEGR